LEKGVGELSRFPVITFMPGIERLRLPKSGR
jgi:hypothetical protein